MGLCVHILLPPRWSTAVQRAHRLPHLPENPKRRIHLPRGIRHCRAGSGRKTTRIHLSFQTHLTIPLIYIPFHQVNDPTQRLAAPDIKNHPFFAPITDWKALWTISPPTLEAGLYKRPPPDPNAQGLNIGWANWADGDMDGEEDEMDEPPPDYIVRRIVPEVIGVRVTRDEDAVLTAAKPTEAPEAVPKSSLDSGGLDLAGPLPIVASQVGSSTTGETNSVASYSSSEGQHGPWNSVASGGGNSSTSKGFELVRGIKGLSVDANSSSSSARWHLANG